jgi:putative ABC transport system substrate-binding protein
VADCGAGTAVGYAGDRVPRLYIARYVRGSSSQGLKDTGYFAGQNVAIEYRWAENQIDRLPELAAELVRRQVAVIATGAPASTFAAKAATTTIPIVFIVAEDPVRLGLVASLARPGGNLTGMNFFTAELAAKRLELLHELVPRAVRVAVLVNPSGYAAETTLSDMESAAGATGLQLQVINADSEREIDDAFESFAREQPDALFVGPGPFFFSQSAHLAQLAQRHAVPATYQFREAAMAGGLMSYGASVVDAYRQMGVYIGRILKGEKPADLPVLQPTKFDLVINLKTAKLLSLDVPPSLLARADEVIE